MKRLIFLIMLLISCYPAFKDGGKIEIIEFNNDLKLRDVGCYLKTEFGGGWIFMPKCPAGIRPGDRIRVRLEVIPNEPSK